MSLFAHMSVCHPAGQGAASSRLDDHGRVMLLAGDSTGRSNGTVAPSGFRSIRILIVSVTNAESPAGWRRLDRLSTTLGEAGDCWFRQCPPVLARLVESSVGLSVTCGRLDRT